jgi:ABC-type Fe3+/spermidine/putrescine transport system ATPase subunit
MIAMRSVTKTYASREVLHQINLCAESGTIYGLLGVNGAGKTTAFKLLAGLLYPTSGEIVFNGQPITMRRRAFLKDMGIMIETPVFYEHLSALASAMGYRYVIREYCGAQAILLFSYPISPKRILTAKTLLLMMFTSIAASGGKKISITTGAVNLHVVQLFYIMIDSFDDDCLKLTAVIKYQEKVQILSLVKCIPPRLL